MRKVFSLVGIVFLAVSVLALAGCATHSSQSVRTETVQHEPTVVHHVESTETTSYHGDHPGLLSGTVHVVGDVLALPFHVVGGLLGVLF